MKHLKSIFENTNKPKPFGYLYGEYKIKNVSAAVDNGDDTETKIVSLSNGTDVEIWREIGTDDWYDENTNPVSVYQKKKVVKRGGYNSSFGGYD